MRACVSPSHAARSIAQLQARLFSRRTLLKIAPALVKISSKKAGCIRQFNRLLASEAWVTEIDKREKELSEAMGRYHVRFHFFFSLLWKRLSC